MRKGIDCKGVEWEEVELPSVSADLTNKTFNKLTPQFPVRVKPIRLVEFDGPQHNEPVDWFGGDIRFQIMKENDILKNQYALSHNIPLVRISYSKRDMMTYDDIFGDKYLIKGDNNYG